MSKKEIIKLAIDMVETGFDIPSCSAIDLAARECTGDLDHALVGAYQYHSNARIFVGGFFDIPVFMELPFKARKQIRIERLTAFLETLED